MQLHTLTYFAIVASAVRSVLGAPAPVPGGRYVTGADGKQVWVEDSEVPETEMVSDTASTAVRPSAIAGKMLMKS